MESDTDSDGWEDESHERDNVRRRSTRFHTDPIEKKKLKLDSQTKRRMKGLRSGFKQYSYSGANRLKKKVPCLSESASNKPGENAPCNHEQNQAREDLHDKGHVPSVGRKHFSLHS